MTSSTILLKTIKRSFRLKLIKLQDFKEVKLRELSKQNFKVFSRIPAIWMISQDIVLISFEHVLVTL